MHKSDWSSLAVVFLGNAFVEASCVCNSLQFLPIGIRLILEIRLQDAGLLQGKAGSNTLRSMTS